MSIAAGEYVLVSTLEGVLACCRRGCLAASVHCFALCLGVPPSLVRSIARICVCLVLRVPLNALMALASSCFRCNVVGYLELSCRLPGRAFCCCAFWVSSFVFPDCDVYSAVCSIFSLCAFSLRSWRVRRTSFVRRAQGFRLLPYVLGFGGFPSATVVASHSGGPPGGALCPHSPLELRWLPLASRASGWSVHGNARCFSRRLAQGTRLCTFLHFLATCVDQPLPNAAYHSPSSRVSVFACLGFVFGHRSDAEIRPMLFCARYWLVRPVPPACWLHADVLSGTACLHVRDARCRPSWSRSLGFFLAVDFRKWSPHGRWESVCMAITLPRVGAISADCVNPLQPPCPARRTLYFLGHPCAWPNACM